MQRSLNRRVVLQLLYEKLSGGNNDEESMNLILSVLPSEKPIHFLQKADREYVDFLLNGIIAHDEELQDSIRSHLAEGWTEERLNRIDLCILMLGSFEICYSDLSDNIAISEAMKLADLFTDDKNKRFINAVLGAISREKEQQNDSTIDNQ